MIKSKLIKKYKNISHGFFNRQGGFSNGIYQSLNCGIGSKDKRNNILRNIKKKSIKNKIDPKITNRIWKNMILSYIDFERRNFKKK